MLGFSKRRFFVTLGLSILIWLVSGVVQLLVQQDTTLALFSFGGSCEITGYPIALCISNNDDIKFLLISFANIMLWFWVLHFGWKWFDKRRSQK